ncbi:hypothetical protein MJO28_014754 [Puccinia striiformis f. sp. tritici]|nr:hypothetical protein MJO28_014754 [Puccinia striiformis f. sp. tritici]
MRTALIWFYALVLAKPAVALLISSRSSQRSVELPNPSGDEMLDLNMPATDEPSTPSLSSAESRIGLLGSRPALDLNLPCSDTGSVRTSSEEHIVTENHDQTGSHTRKRDYLVFGEDVGQRESLSKKGRTIMNHTDRDSSHDSASRIMDGVAPHHVNLSNNAQRYAENIRDIIIPGKFTDREQRLNGNLPKPFDVYDWDYVREAPYIDVGDGQGLRHARALHTLLMSLDSLRFKPKHDLRFFIPENETSSFLRAYRSRKLQFPPGLTRGERRGALWKIAMSVSNHKIAVDQYSIFNEEILEPIRKRLESLDSNLKTVGIEPLLPHQIDLILGYVANVTKVTIFFAITYLSLFKKHPKDRLSTELVEEILMFLKKFWQDTKNAESKLRQENEWAIVNAIILRTEEIDRNPSSYKYWLSGNSCYNMAWHVAMYWRRENMEKFIGTEVKDQGYYESTIFDLINKIVIYANYQDSQSFLHFWGDKKRV